MRLFKGGADISNTTKDMNAGILFAIVFYLGGGSVADDQQLSIVDGLSDLWPDFLNKKINSLNVR